MAIATQFQSWQNGRQPAVPYTSCSPSLRSLRTYMLGRWDLVDLGCYGRRPIRGGTAWSSHAFGAAVDLGYSSRAPIDDDVLPWLIEHSAELGLQRIHDYAKKCYWQAGRGWIMRPPGNGGSWLHIETHWSTWADGRAVGQKVDGVPAPTEQPPSYPGKPVKLGATGESVEQIQAKVGAAVDGQYGPKTEAAVVDWQAQHGLLADGKVGKITWSAMFPS